LGDLKGGKGVYIGPRASPTENLGPEQHNPSVKRPEGKIRAITHHWKGGGGKSFCPLEGKGRRVSKGLTKHISREKDLIIEKHVTT